jgi:hypothetical protein
MSEPATQQNNWEPIWAQEADDEYVRAVLASSAGQIESFLVSDEQTEE